jgi:hypothetical protein
MQEISVTERTSELNKSIPGFSIMGYNIYATGFHCLGRTNKMYIRLAARYKEALINTTITIQPPIAFKNSVHQPTIEPTFYPQDLLFVSFI